MKCHYLCLAASCTLHIQSRVSSQIEMQTKQEGGEVSCPVFPVHLMILHRRSWESTESPSLTCNDPIWPECGALMTISWFKRQQQTHQGEDVEE